MIALGALAKKRQRPTALRGAAELPVAMDGAIPVERRIVARRTERNGPSRVLPRTTAVSHAPRMPPRSLTSSVNHVSVRVDASTLARLDALAADLGPGQNRSDVLRALCSNVG